MLKSGTQFPRLCPVPLWVFQMISFLFPCVLNKTFSTNKSRPGVHWLTFMSTFVLKPVVKFDLYKVGRHSLFSDRSFNHLVQESYH